MKDGKGSGGGARREVGAERPRSVAARQFARKRGAGRMRVVSRGRSVHVVARTELLPSRRRLPVESGVLVCTCACVCVCACEQPSVMRSDF